MPWRRMAAACVRSTPSGILVQSLRSTVAYSAYVDPDRIATASPTFKSQTPSPTASMNPAASLPGINGSGSL